VVRQLHVREIEYLQREEWALEAEDILWRRSKLGLHLSANATETLTRWLNAKAGS
jgi:glycerol-3-phosphate dehydrogenase